MSLICILFPFWQKIMPITWEPAHKLILGRSPMNHLIEALKGTFPDVVRFSSVQFSRSVVSDSVTPWTAACWDSLTITNSRSLLKLVSNEQVMPFSHLILCHPLLVLPSIFPSIRVFSNESALCIRWPKYWSFSFSISPPMNTQD